MHNITHTMQSNISWLQHSQNLWDLRFKCRPFH